MPQYAVWFYMDHEPSGFVAFQTKYLDNIWSKFLYKEGFLFGIPIWFKSGSMTDMDKDTRGHQEEGTLDFANQYEVDPTPSKAKDEIIEKLKSYHVPIPSDVSTYPLRALEDYFETLQACLENSCSSIGSILRKKNRNYVHLYEKEDYNILIYGRYSGSVLIKGKVGGQDMIFCYGNSCKYEIPCTSFEIFKGVFEDTLTEVVEELEDANLGDRWKAERVGIFEYGLFDSVFEDLNATNQDSKRLKIAGHEMIKEAEESYAGIETMAELRLFMAPLGATPDFLKVLASLADRTFD